MSRGGSGIGGGGGSVGGGGTRRGGGDGPDLDLNAVLHQNLAALSIDDDPSPGWSQLKTDVAGYVFVAHYWARWLGFMSIMPVKWYKGTCFSEINEYRNMAQSKNCCGRPTLPIPGGKILCSAGGSCSQTKQMSSC